MEPFSIIKSFSQVSFPTNPLKRHVTTEEKELLKQHFPNKKHSDYVDANNNIVLSKTCSIKYINVDDLKLLITPVEPLVLKPYKNGPNVLFANCGVEPTFYPQINIPSILLDLDANIWQESVDNVVSNLATSGKFRELHDWCSSPDNDEGVLELPSGHEYTKAEAITKDFNSLLLKLKPYSIVPSSVECREGEGGCHVNFNLKDKLINESYKDIINLFGHNLINFLNTYPSLVWGFLAPEDNESSNIICKKYNCLDDSSKGDMLTFRATYDYINIRRVKNIEYIELRFFMMPRTTKEFAYHIKVGSQLLKYIWNQTIKSPDKLVFQLTNSRDSLREYTFSKCIKQLNHVLPLLGLTYKEFVSFGKNKMLKERFSFGKNYLI